LLFPLGEQGRLTAEAKQPFISAQADDGCTNSTPQFFALLEHCADHEAIRTPGHTVRCHVQSDVVCVWARWLLTLCCIRDHRLDDSVTGAVRTAYVRRNCVSTAMHLHLLSGVGIMRALSSERVLLNPLLRMHAYAFGMQVPPDGVGWPACHGITATVLTRHHHAIVQRFRGVAEPAHCKLTIMQHTMANPPPDVARLHFIASC
jgi:hypothetical protein